MMLTTKGRYAVMAIIDIAHNSKTKPVSLKEVSARQNITLNYLEQIFQKLRNSGLLKASKGPGGGYSLAQDPKDIRISKIIDAVGEGVKITRCENEFGCVKHNVKCSVHDLWFGLGDAIRSYLDNVSVLDVLEGNVNDISRQ